MSDASTTTQPESEATNTRYVPGDVEPRWIDRWEADGTFNVEVTEGREAYTIVVPPPNVTGALHMGHALNGSIQDCLIRWKRMQGYDALWIPGVDHAGIATQAVVEKLLRKEGTSRHELGREKFLGRVQEWKDQYAETIHGQFRRLGSSMDFRRARFTMDEQYAKAVIEAFVRLYESGNVYRANRLVNWDAGTMSAISDLEVRQIELTDEMVEVAYPVLDAKDGNPTGEEIVIATVRPETIVADVAVAVHPEDDRYASLVGKFVRVPFTDRSVPIIADDYVDREFGTGALKITPGHDPNDFEIGVRHGLEQLSAINPDRTMSKLAGDFAGLDADTARKQMTNALEESGALRSREPYKHMVPHSDRSGVRIEPLISLQWFADMVELAKPVIKWVYDGDVRFVPDGSKSIFFSWMEDLQPWCLSRQLWWGHRLPVWYCTNDETHVHVSADGPGDSACPDCGNTEWRRDEDVLDTWFSSGMWDHATLGWPNKTQELEHFHPTSVLCTARDIINLWVARMMMFSNAHLGEVPFRDVYIHSTVQAADGRRMSKSLGTGVDPLDLIAEYGADATRYGLLDMSSTQDVRFNEGRIREGRDLANKLWNAVRLLTTSPGGVDRDAVDNFNPADAQRIEDRWILTRLDKVLREVHSSLERYEFALAVKAMYHFCWNELCDWYLESVKLRLRDENDPDSAQTRTILAWVLDNTIRMLHPVMPHLTEELSVQIWGESAGYVVATADWPLGVFENDIPTEFRAADAQFEQIRSIVTRIRSLRQAAGVKPRVRLSGSITGDGIDRELLDAGVGLFVVLAHVDLTHSEIVSGEGVITMPVGAAAVLLDGLDPEQLKPKIASDLKTAQQELKRAEGKLANERFTSRAPAELVAEERAKIERYKLESQQLEQLMEQL